MMPPVKAAESDIALVHSKGYMDLVRRSCRPGRYISLDPDTVCSETPTRRPFWPRGR
jgi:acetoin utilization deacetylase AcuC-like enzyme